MHPSCLKLSSNTLLLRPFRLYPLLPRFRFISLKVPFVVFSLSPKWAVHAPNAFLLLQPHAMLSAALPITVQPTLSFLFTGFRSSPIGTFIPQNASFRLCLTMGQLCPCLTSSCCRVRSVVIAPRQTQDKKCQMTSLMTSSGIFYRS